MLRGPHLVKPSALPQTLLTVSGICKLNLMLIGAPVDVVLIVVADAKGFATREISAGFKDDMEQSQFERMLAPAIAKIIKLPGLITIIWLPTFLQGTSV